MWLLSPAIVSATSTPAFSNSPAVSSDAFNESKSPGKFAIALKITGTLAAASSALIGNASSAPEITKSIPKRSFTLMSSSMSCARDTRTTTGFSPFNAAVNSFSFLEGSALSSFLSDFFAFAIFVCCSSNVSINSLKDAAREPSLVPPKLTIIAFWLSTTLVPNSPLKLTVELKPTNGLSPQLGAITSRVIPPLRAYAMSVDFGLNASDGSKVMPPFFSLPSRDEATAPTSTKPSWFMLPIKPGVTILPCASIITSAVAASVVMALILPSSMITLPFLITPCSDAVWICALIIAVVCAIAPAELNTAAASKVCLNNFITVFLIAGLT